MPLIGKENVIKAMDNLVVEAGKDVRAIYFAGLSAVIKQTPVDEGRARNNWFLTVGTPSSEIASSKSSNGANSFAQLGTMPQDVLNKTIYFTNNLPYIGVLEYGGYPNPPKKGSWNKKKKAYEIRSINGFSALTDGKPWVRPIIIAMRAKLRAL